MEKNRYLIQLLDVIRVLKGSEAELAKKHLKAYETNHTANRGKMFQLYKYIKIKHIEDYNKLKKKISPNSTDDSFNKLIRRTTDRIQESLIIDVNIRRKGAYNDVFRMKFFIRKQLIEGQILMGRGLKERPLHLFDNSIRYAKKYELYDELLEALYFKQILSSNIIGIRDFKRIDSKIEFYENCRTLLRKARHTRNLYDIGNFSKSNTKSVSKSFETKVEKLKQYYEETGSANILSYYYLLKIEIERSKNNNREVAHLVRDFIELLKVSPAIFSNERIAYLSSELASTELTLLKFETALEEVDNSFNWMKNKGLMYVISCIRRLNILMLLCEFEKIKNEVDRLTKLPVVKKHPYHFAIITYYKAICDFGLSNFKETFNTISDKIEIEKDKEGWNVWIRIMRILCSIELLKLNMIDYDVESFRKYIQRVDKQYTVRERDKLVLVVLIELDKQSYDFEATAIEKEEELTKLRSTNKKYAWNPDSPELILFHEWFEAKRLKKAYQPNFEMYREAIEKGN